MRTIQNPKTVPSAPNIAGCQARTPQPHRQSEVTIGNQQLTEKNLRMPAARRLLAYGWLVRAGRLRSEGNMQQAVDACRRAVALNPQHPESHRQLASNLHALKRYDAVIPVLRRVLTLRPQDPTANHLLNAIESRPTGNAPADYVNRLFDRFAATFDQRMNGVLNYRVPALLGKRLHPFTRQRGHFDSALDLGCGTGLAGSVLRPVSRHMTGVDLSRKMLQKASEKGLYDALVCDDILRFLNRCQASFDIVSAADVFIYIGDLTSVFRLVQKRLEPNGIFAFSTERARSTPYRLRKSGRFAHSPDYIDRLAARNRLQILSRDRIGLRMEQHRWVNGDLFLLGGPSVRVRRSRRMHRLWKRIGRLSLPGGWMRIFRR